ncbi:glycosyltransferase family 4 protein [Mycobacterium sp. WMMD1722]|uniref:glycosyltransferase family 4 protein n=1 Tax=Mycobacterium sp. WMMD1722 TaxID=3404117 RepID=UPI003BF5D2A1
MTRVLAVSSARDVMGTEHSLLNVTPRLSSRGLEMMLAAERSGSFESRWRDMGLTFYDLDLPRRQGFRPNTGRGFNSVAELARLPIRTVRAIIGIVTLVRRSRAEVIHSNCLITHFDCAVAGRVTGATPVLELHDIVAPGIGRLFMGVAVRIAGRAIAISSAVRDQLPRWAREKVVVVPQSVDVERFGAAAAPGDWRTRLAAAPEVPLIAAVGRLDPEKGLHVLVEAVAELRASGVEAQLALVGSPSKDGGGYLAELRTLGDRLLGDALRIVPQVDDVPAVLQAVDILACPSFEEPFGLILLEAQACGVPVVASASGGPLEFITHDRTGLLVAPGDPGALAGALSRLLRDGQLRARIARAGQDRVRRAYTADIRADRIAEVYRGGGGWG